MGEGHKKTKSSMRSCKEGVAAPDLSEDELLASLVKESPRAEVILDGVPVTCVLDTCAETSLTSASFYQEHLADKQSGLKPLGAYLEVYGVGGLEVPIAGYIHIPLTVFHQTVVVEDSCNEGLLNSKKSPILL